MVYFRTELFSGQGLKIIRSVAFINDFDSEHSLDYVFHSHNASHAAVFVGYNRDMFFFLQHLAPYIRYLGVLTEE